jgi:hypothetical protein
MVRPLPRAELFNVVRTFSAITVQIAVGSSKSNNSGRFIGFAEFKRVVSPLERAPVRAF